MSELVSTWQIHDRINRYLLESIDEAHLDFVAASKGRNVREQFVHIHNVRLMWLKAAAPELLEGQVKIEKEDVTDKALLTQRLSDSGAAIAKLLEKGIAEGKIKNFKPHVTGFLGYIISHESHHRGQIMIIMKENKFPVDKKIGFGIWEWGSR